MLGQAAGTIARELFGVVDDLFTSDEERAEAKRKLLEMEQRGELAQIKVNLAEADHESVFVAGWRPGIGWICGAALAYHYIVQPFAQFVVVVAGIDPDVADALPQLDLGGLMPVLLGMLGLGGMRSFEKSRGKKGG
jgi:hypothetical protein